MIAEYIGSKSNGHHLTGYTLPISKVVTITNEEPEE